MCIRDRTNPKLQRQTIEHHILLHTTGVEHRGGKEKREPKRILKEMEREQRDGHIMHRDRETRQRDREAEGQIMEVVRRVAWVDGHWRNCEARDAFPSSTRRLRGSEAWKPRSWNRDARDAFPSSTRRPGGSEAWKLRPWLQVN